VLFSRLLEQVKGRWATIPEPELDGSVAARDTTNVNVVSERNTQGYIIISFSAILTSSFQRHTLPGYFLK
jgi:hypothetical protein